MLPLSREHLYDDPLLMRISTIPQHAPIHP
jgi:hypothetical protein